jgi:hypothetical protein
MREEPASQYLAKNTFAVQHTNQDVMLAILSKPFLVLLQISHPSRSCENVGTEYLVLLIDP